MDRGAYVGVYNIRCNLTNSGYRQRQTAGSMGSVGCGLHWFYSLLFLHLNQEQQTVAPMDTTTNTAQAASSLSLPVLSFDATSASKPETSSAKNHQDTVLRCQTNS